MPDVNRLKEQARTFYQKGEWDKARRAAEQILLFDSEDPEFNLTVGNIYHEAGEERRALDQYEKTLRISEKSGDYGRAIVACKKILAIDRERIELYNKAGEFYFRTGLKTGTVREWLKYIDQLKLRSDYTAISGTFQKITGILPENPQLKALSDRLKGMADRLLSDTSENAPEPADIAPYRRLVDVALKMGQPKKIVETQLSYARVLQRKGFQRKAKAIYQKVLERDPTNEEALSKVLAMQDTAEVDLSKLREEFFKTGREFQDAVWTRIDEAYEPYYDLGELYRAEGLRDEAIIEFQQAIKGGDRQLKSFEMLAVSFLEQGDFGFAKEVLHQGLSIKKFLDNEYVGLHYNLGLAHEQMGDLQKAISEYEQVYILDITYKDVATRLRGIEVQLRGPKLPAPATPRPSSLDQARDKSGQAHAAQAPKAPQPAVEVAPPLPVPEIHIEVVKSAVAAAPVAEPEPIGAVLAMPPEPEPEPAAAEEPAEPEVQPEVEEAPAEEEAVYLKDQGLSFL